MSVKLQLKVAPDGQLAYDRFPLGNLPDAARDNAEALVTKVEFIVVHHKVRWIKFYCNLLWYFLVFALITYTAVVYLKESPGIAKRIEGSISTDLALASGEEYLDLSSWTDQNYAWVDSLFEKVDDTSTPQPDELQAQLSGPSTNSSSELAPETAVKSTNTQFICGEGNYSSNTSAMCSKLQMALDEIGLTAAANNTHEQQITNDTVNIVFSVLEQTARARQFRLIFWYAVCFLLAKLYGYCFADAVFHWNNQRILKGILYRENTDIFWQSGYYWFMDANNMDLMAVRFAPKLQRKTSKIRNHLKKSTKNRWPSLPALSLEEVSEIAQEDAVSFAAPSPINSFRLNSPPKKPKSRASSQKSGNKKVVFSEPEVTEPESAQESHAKEEASPDPGTQILPPQTPPDQVKPAETQANNMLWQQQMYQQWMMHQQYMFFQMMRQHEQGGVPGNVNMSAPNANVPPFGAAFYGPVNNYYNQMAPMYAAQFAGDPMAAQWMAANMQNQQQIGAMVDPDQTEEFSVSAVEETEEASQPENSFSKHRSLGKEGPRVSLAATTRKHPRSSKSNKKN